MGEDRDDEAAVGVETVVLRLEVEMKRLRGGGLGFCEKEETEEVEGREEVGRALAGELATEDEG